jgi:hypothetical protein
MLMVIIRHIRLESVKPCIKILQISLTKIGVLSILLQGDFNDGKAI